MSTIREITGKLDLLNIQLLTFTNEPNFNLRNTPNETIIQLIAKIVSMIYKISKFSPTLYKAPTINSASDLLEPNSKFRKWLRDLDKENIRISDKELEEENTVKFPLDGTYSPINKYDILGLMAIKTDGLNGHVITPSPALNELMIEMKIKTAMDIRNEP